MDASIMHLWQLRKQRADLHRDIGLLSKALVGRKQTCPASAEVYRSIELRITDREKMIKEIDLEIFLLGGQL